MDEDPGVEDEDPVGHKAQALVPAVFEYVPPGHTTHVLALVAPDTPENAPAGHCAQTVALLAPVTPEYVPAEQLTHALDPVAVLYWPATHAEQVPPFGPVYPALHVQLLRNPLLAPANAFAGHRLQLGLPSGDHSPGAHAKHVSFPVAP